MNAHTEAQALLAKLSTKQLIEAMNLAENSRKRMTGFEDEATLTAISLHNQEIRQTLLWIYTELENRVEGLVEAIEQIIEDEPVSSYGSRSRNYTDLMTKALEQLSA